MENFIYNDYASWLIENSELLNNLEQQNSFIYKRYQHVLDVVKHFYDLKVETNELDDEQNHIFEVGFYYLFDQFENIRLLLENTYDKNYEELNKHQKTIELLLNTIEFENDIFALVDEPEKEIDKFLEIEEEVLKYLEKKETAPEELFEKLNKISVEVYDSFELEYYPISEIFYDIAIEIGLV